MLFSRWGRTRILIDMIYANTNNSCFLGSFFCSCNCLTSSYYLLTVNMFPNTRLDKFCNSIPRNALLCSFITFLTVSLIPSANKLESSSDFIIFIISSMASTDITKTISHPRHIAIAHLPFNGNDIFLAKGRTIFITGHVNLPNKVPKNSSR